MMNKNNKSKMYYCSNCCCKINTNSKMYRCTDTYVCSPQCAKDRFNMIRKIDPEINSPQIWPLQNPKYNTMFNSNIISNINNNKNKWLNIKNISSVSDNLYKYDDTTNKQKYLCNKNTDYNEENDDYDHSLDDKSVSNLYFMVNNHKNCDKKCSKYVCATLCLITLVIINVYN